MIYTRKQFISDAYDPEISIDAIMEKRRVRIPLEPDLERAFDAVVAEAEVAHPGIGRVTADFLADKTTADELVAFLCRFGLKMKLEEIATRMGKRFSDIVSLVVGPINRLKKEWIKAVRPKRSWLGEFLSLGI
jgi:hypothetical protein